MVLDQVSGEYMVERARLEIRLIDKNNEQEAWIDDLISFVLLIVEKGSPRDLREAENIVLELDFFGKRDLLRAIDRRMAVH